MHMLVLGFGYKCPREGSLGKCIQSSEVTSSGSEGEFGHFGLCAFALFHYYATSVLFCMTCEIKRSWGGGLSKLSAGGTDI